RLVAETVGGRAYKRLVVSFAADCAERVLGIFEKRFPHDRRSREAIEAARAWVAAPSDAAAKRALDARGRGWSSRAAAAAAAADADAADAADAAAAAAAAADADAAAADAAA